MKREKDNIIISIYSGSKRLKVLSLTPSLLKKIILINSLIVVAFVIFFMAYLVQWTENWGIREQNKLLEKEVVSLKK